MKTPDALSRINPAIRGLAAYHLDAVESAVKLNQNENPFDWPESVKASVARLTQSRPWNRYPPFIPASTKEAIASYAGVDADSVCIGNGSNEMLLILYLCLVRQGTDVILCEPTFTVYRLLADMTGATVVPVLADNNLRHTDEALCAAVTEHPGALLVLCSPNNPTGTSLTEETLRKVLSLHTGFCILDQAYVEFGGYNAIPLLSEFANCIITRTFSKALGGAGMRLGYMIGSSGVMAELSKAKLPYNINFFTLAAAEAVLARQDVLQARIEVLREQRQRLFSLCENIDAIRVYPSDANFICIGVPDREALFRFLTSRGILVRDVSGYPLLEQCLRLSVGTEQETGLLMEALTAFFHAS